MKARVVTALVGIPVFLAALCYGGIAWASLMLAVTIIGTNESGRLVAKQGVPPLEWVSQALACSLVIYAYLVSGDDLSEWSVSLAPLVGGVSIIFLLNTLWSQPADRAGLLGVGATLATALYPSIFVAHLVALRGGGLYPLLLAVLVTWATDTAAFFVGSAAGRRPLWPKISPNKTVEGALGGIGGGVAVSMGLATLYGLPIGPWAFVGLVASIGAQLGDLLESGLKRHAGVKDSGTLLPGHGGVLDRMDSLFLSGTIVYYLMHVVG